MPLKTYVDEPTPMNLTSMIDVLFLLIMFFMLSTKFDDYERQMEVRLSSVSANNLTMPASQQQVIHILNDGQLVINGKRIPLSDLDRELDVISRTSSKQEVLIRPDQSAPWNSIAQVHAACNRARLSVAGVATSNLNR